MISLLWCFFVVIKIEYSISYSNQLFTIPQIADDKSKEFICEKYEGIENKVKLKHKMHRKFKHFHYPVHDGYLLPKATTTATNETNEMEIDPYIIFQETLNDILFGKDIEYKDGETNVQKMPKIHKTGVELHYPSGNLFRSELFMNRSGVHLPLPEFIHRGFCMLKITKDYMQTAVNAMAIFLEGTVEDIGRIPADYLLRSARTISMMILPREKFAKTWFVIKGNKRAIQITYETLAAFRPLFKYVSGKEIARLNLSDTRILAYIGTHAELDRHQVGVIASKYIELNKNWQHPQYLNLMNNLLCGVPMSLMRQLPESTFLQLSQQIFYHIHACDPLQRRFYLALMTRTQVLGKSYSWRAREVSRLGLLLSEVRGPELSAINPKAMAGLTSKVMLTMAPQNLQYLTEIQLKYITPKSLNILARKLKEYQDQEQIYGKCSRNCPATVYALLFLVSLM